jgi:hypothetical protein
VYNANPADEDVDAALGTMSPAAAPADMRGYVLALPIPPEQAQRVDVQGTPLEDQPFNNALTLYAVHWNTSPTPGEQSWLKFWWQVIAPLPLPPEILIPNPPPPEVYNGPRLKIFTHLLAEDGTFITGDDGLWVDPYSLQAGDHFMQWHRFTLPNDAPQPPYTLNVGMYDPLTGERWMLTSGEDQIAIEVK